MHSLQAPISSDEGYSFGSPIVQELLHKSGNSGILDGVFHSLDPEFKGAFIATCSRLGISRHQLPPRSPNLNALVERFQGSVLHLHYRTAFRYRFYTHATDIEADLQAWMRFYNFERPHRGYRTKGRRPAETFYAHRPDLLEMRGWDSDDFIPQSVRP